MTLKDSTQEALDAGIATIRRNYDASVKRGRLTAEAVGERLGAITPMLGYDGVATADLVIEAVFENLALKKQVFRELDAVAQARRGPRHQHLDARHRRDRRRDGRPQDRSSACISSARRTSCGCSRSCAARQTAQRRRWRPRWRSPSGSARSAWWSATAAGFVGNRMMFPYMYEAQFLAEEGRDAGAGRSRADDFGMAMGIFAVDDMAGLDVAWRVRQELGHFAEPGERQAARGRQAVRDGPVGQKTGRGWYRYDEQRKADSGSGGHAI